MRFSHYFTHLLLILLLAFMGFASVSAKTVSGLQNLERTWLQGKTVSNCLMHQEKTGASQNALSGCLDVAKRVEITKPYKRPSGATNKKMRESVQGQPCVKCGDLTDRQVAGHKKALVEEYYETGTIDKKRMRSLDAIQPECPTCSAKEGVEMSRFSRQKKKELGL